MAHILVYMQRTPVGLHPASAIGLCRARDIASERGATLTSICHGDAGAYDRGVAMAAGRFGADILVFGGPSGLMSLYEQLNPVHVLVPWTAEGLEIAEQLPTGPAVPRWLTTPQPAWSGADAISAVVAGTMPWRAMTEKLEAEYQSNVDEVDLPKWLDTPAAEEGQDQPMFSVGGKGPTRWVASRTPDRETEALLGRLGATPANADDPLDDAGTLLWLSDEALPPALAKRPPSTRLMVVPGSDAELDPSWTSAEWVLSGSRASALESVLNSPWVPLDG